MLSKILQFVKDYRADIILIIGVILISLLSFAMGYIVAKQQEKEPLKIEKIENIKLCRTGSPVVTTGKPSRQFISNLQSGN